MEKNLFFETVFVGLFSLAIYLGVRSITLDIFDSGRYREAGILFTTGVLKHWLGYWIGLQDVYCLHYTGLPHAPLPSSISILLEGVVYIFIGGFFHSVIKDLLFGVFLTGVIIHLFSELTGVHQWFLKKCYS